MNKNRSKNEKVQLTRVKSNDKVVLPISKIRPSRQESSTQLMSKGQKRQIKTQANQVKNKIGKFLEKYKSKAGEIKSPSLGLFQTINQVYGKESLGDSFEDTDPYQFRKKNNFILEKGCKKPEPAKTSSSSSQYQLFSQPKLAAKMSSAELHPQTNNIQQYSDSVSTTCSQHKQSSKMSLQDFSIGKKLGSGKYGQVFLAKHKKSKLMFALKKIEKAELDENNQKQIIHEIKIQIFIDHPNIVKLYTFFFDQKCLYLVLELSTSGHLYDYLQKKIYVEERVVKHIVKQVCQGLKHLHDNNIIHRDVKLENILYQLGMVKICDFGWSIETEDLRQTFCGTPLYISPQILQQKGYDNKIDVWCVGILTFELLYGRVPFEIREKNDFQKIVYEEVNFPEEPVVSKSAKKFLTACLTKDPQFRPGFNQLLKFAFFQNCEALKSSQLF